MTDETMYEVWAVLKTATGGGLPFAKISKRRMSRDAAEKKAARLLADSEAYRAYAIKALTSLAG